MRHEPALIYRIAVKAAAQLIVHAAFGHLAERDRHHVECFLVARAGIVAQQEIMHRRARKFWRAAEPAQLRIEHPAECMKGMICYSRIKRGIAGGDSRLPLKLAENLIAGFDNTVAVLSPGARDMFEYRAESRPVVPIVRREISAAEKRFSIRRKPDRHRPAAAPGCGLHEHHIDTIHVGTFLPVDFDRDEGAVQQVGDFFGLERLALHYVTPVARGVANGEENWLVLASGFFKRFLTPGKPVHRIVGVLQQIGALLVGEAIGGHAALLLAGHQWTRSTRMVPMRYAAFRMARISRRDLLAGMAGVAAAPAGMQSAQAPGKLNIIHIGVDTFGTHWLGCYGNQEVRTPNVDKFSKKCVMFEDAYPEALPTLCARRAIYTGRRIFPSDLIQQPDDQVKIRGWHQLYAEDVTISETLRGAGYTTAIVSDLYHQFKPDKNFHRGFDSWRWIRGQEQDRLETGPKKAIPIANYMHPAYPNGGQAGVMQYLLNRRTWKTTEDYMAARTFNEASQWLENNAGEAHPFYLHVESFWPHEYWDPPEEFYRLYMQSDYQGPRFINDTATTEKMSPVEVEHARALYAGLVTFVDDRIGRFLRDVEKLG